MTKFSYIIAAALLIPTCAQANIYETMTNKACHAYFDVQSVKIPKLTVGKINSLCGCMTDSMLNYLEPKDFPVNGEMDFFVIERSNNEMTRALSNAARYCALAGYYD